MKKILFFIHDMEEGGAQKVLTNLVNNMSGDLFDISVVSMFGGGINEQSLLPHIRYKSVFPKPFPGNSILQKFVAPSLLHKLCIRERYDIEISYLEGVSARVISGCSNTKTKKICWIHSTIASEKEVAVCFRSYDEAVSCYSKYDCVVGVAKSVEKMFCSSVVNLKRTTTLYNTLDSNSVRENSRESVEDGVFVKNEIKLIGVGSLKPVKGFDRLLRIHHRLLEEGYPVHTYLVGQGSDMEKLKEQVEVAGDFATVTFLGYQTNPYKYVAKCDLFVCASHAEGFSTAATEALIVGTPVVTTLVSGMKEMLGENNEYGIITENNEEALYEGIKRLLDEPVLLAHYKEKAIERGKMFSTEATVKAVEEMLLSL